MARDDGGDVGGGGGRDIFRSDEDRHGGWRVQREGQPPDRQRILDAQRPRHPGMVGGGYGGLQGGGLGGDSADIRGELQGISYGRGWGGGVADASSAELGAERARWVRGRGPKSYRRSDVRVSEDVSERLMRDPRIDASDIEVRVENGTVTLSGTVEDRDTKWLAEDVVEDVSGVREVENQLKVRRRSAQRSEG